jgi:hypothetical protein
MTARLIPERTVDSMFAIEIAQFVPHAIVWSPTNTRGQIDHLVFGPGVRALTFECKGTVSDARMDPSKPWKSPIDYRQLYEYLGSGLPVLYVLPAKPRIPASPWIRHCDADPDTRGACSACHNGSDRQSRRWAGTSPTVRGAAIHHRFQPWFAHWCWVIPSRDLDAYLSSIGRPLELPTADSSLRGIAGADRLCHFLDSVRAGTVELDDIWIDAVALAANLREVAPASAQRIRPDDGDDPATLQIVFVPPADHL